MIILKTSHLRSLLVWLGVLFVCNQSLCQSVSEASLKVSEHKGQVEITWQGFATQGIKYQLERSRDSFRFNPIFEFESEVNSYTDYEAVFGLYHYRLVSVSGEVQSQVVTVESYSGDSPIYLRTAKPGANRFNLVLGNCQPNDVVLMGIYKLNGEEYKPFAELELERQKLVLDGDTYEKGSYVAVICIPDSHIMLARFEVE